MINPRIKKQLKAILSPTQWQAFFQLIEQKRQAVRPLVRKLRRARA